MNSNPSVVATRKRRVFRRRSSPGAEVARQSHQWTKHLVVGGEAEDSAGATQERKMRPDVAFVDISLKNESGLELQRT
jgi:hypothetical protein